MSSRGGRSSIARHHLEWMQLLDVSGPFLNIGVLSEVFPQGLNPEDRELTDELRGELAAWEDAAGDWDAQERFTSFVLERVLDYGGLVEDGDGIAAELREHRVTLRPDAVVMSGGDPALLLTQYPAWEALHKPSESAGFHASPAERMRLLLRGVGVPTGLVSNGRSWVLVQAPPDRSATFATWHTDLFLEERLTLRAFESLLGATRLFGVPEDETLDALFDRSADDEREVTDQLGYQVRRAVELLVRAFDRADRTVGGALLDNLERERIYEAAVVVAMRLIFLLAAEARGLLPDEGPWSESYAVTPLRGRLQEEAERGGEELLERRFDAWPRLLATFRAVHGGVSHGRIRMPGYGGGLFDPNRHPFLEGVGDTTLRISNRSILHVLDSIQTLEVEVPGGRERRPLSFSALGVEQIGHVYERLLDHTVVRADAPALGLIGKRGEEPEMALQELEAGTAEGEDVLLGFLSKPTGKQQRTLERLLAEEPDPARLGRLHVACEADTDLVERVRPFLGVVRDDDFGMPMVFNAGSRYVTESPERRTTGTYYTPPSLTEPIVKYALEPQVYRGVADGKPPEEWELRAPAELLDLRVCDIAMGSGAFLVAACRFLAARLVEAWEQHPDEVPAGLGADAEERELIARRLVAERCLYGVDKNPLAVEIAKVSLWLTTLRRDRPFTFVDHALRQGDSLLGAASLREVDTLAINSGGTNESLLLEPARLAVRAALEEVRALRADIASSDAPDIQVIQLKVKALERAHEAERAISIVADLVVGAALRASDGDDPLLAQQLIEPHVDRIGGTLESGDEANASHLRELAREAETCLQAGRPPGGVVPRPFHWVLEFPEVFLAPRGGFDAIVGNPPFIGGKKVSGALGSAAREYLVRHIAEDRRGNADLVAFFFLRAGALLTSGGCFGLLATNTIGQGDTREVGLDALHASGSEIYRAVKSRAWPGEAGVYVSHVWVRRGDWAGEAFLDDQPVKGIGSDLDPIGRVEGKPGKLDENFRRAFQGSIVLGKGFLLKPDEATLLLERDPSLEGIVKPYLIAEELTSQPSQGPRRWVIDLGERDEDEARESTTVFGLLEERVYPERRQKDAKKYPRMVNEWWKFWNARREMYEAIAGFDRVLVGPQTAKWWFVTWVENGWVYSHALNVFAYEDDGYAAILSSTLHEAWARKHSGSLKFDLRYSPTDCFENFPFPEDAEDLSKVGDAYLSHRKQTLHSEDQGLTNVYNRLHEHPEDVAGPIVELRRLRHELDVAVAEAYGWSDLALKHDFRETPLGLRYTIDDPTRVEILDRLLELNLERSSAEKAGRAPARTGTGP